ncbi:MAG: GtrA family protein [Gammaproteobacteria bacterium]|nr:GtrA family protein [Gammaproteobacteria bacterium]
MEGAELKVYRRRGVVPGARSCVYTVVRSGCVRPGHCLLPGDCPISLSAPIDLLLRVVRSSSKRATFLRFAAVGGAIAMIDVGLLYLLKDAPGFNIYSARLASYAVAMCAGYLLNRYFTFHHLDRFRTLWHELLRFFSVHSLGGALNYAVFSVIVVLGARAQLQGHWAALLPLLAVWAGGTVGMCFNFLLSRRLVFGK